MNKMSKIGNFIEFKNGEYRREYEKCHRDVRITHKSVEACKE